MTSKLTSFDLEIFFRPIFMKFGTEGVADELFTKMFFFRSRVKVKVTGLPESRKSTILKFYPVCHLE